MLKRKVFKIDRLFTLIAGVLFVIIILYGGFLVFDLTQNVSKPKGPTLQDFITVGYTEKEAAKLVDIKDINLKESLLNIQASDLNYELALTKDMNETKFNQAQTFLEQFDNLEYQDIIIMLEKRGKEDSSNLFQKDRFYIDANKERYLDFSQYFYLDDFDSEEDYVRHIVSSVNSNADLLPYNEPIEADLTTNEKILVNKYYQLASDYEPEDLIAIDEVYGDGRIRELIYDDLTKMIDDCLSSVYEGEEWSLYITSAYRSYDYQEELYNNYVYNDGEELADTYSARAGHSEHQLGLAVDIISYPGQDFDEFQYYSEFTWLASHCHEYGFIIRYTEENVDMTGYQSEPWHFRYVGKEIAEDILRLDIPYDEYYNFYLN